MHAPNVTRKPFVSGRIPRPALLLIVLIVAGLPQWLSPVSAHAARLAQQATSVTPGSWVVGDGRVRYFTQTAHFLRGAFLDYWETHGATPVLGLPITEPIVESGLTVQYLERARIEWHPDISSNPNRAILLTRLGAIMSEASGLNFQRLPLGSDTLTSHFFTETGHNLANAFLTYWQKNGGLAVFGYPISEEFAEVNPTDGNTYSVQYFERNRFEWHPEREQRFNVQLGLLGVEYARYNSLDPLTRVLLPAPIEAAESNLSDDPRLNALVDDALLPAVQALGRTTEFQWVPAVIIENRVLVSFDNTNEEGVAGAFFSSGGNRVQYYIIISNDFKDADMASIASIVAHEVTHAYDLTGGVQPIPRGCTIEEEVRAYLNGLAAYVVIGGVDALQRTYESGSNESRLNNSL
ncbi:MAG: hypothetical protein ABIQ44_14175, partial [Chloroflexia bacterium]